MVSKPLQVSFLVIALSALSGAANVAWAQAPAVDVVMANGGPGQPPCPSTRPNAFEGSAYPNQNLAAAGRDWCEPNEAVVGYAIELPASKFTKADSPSCPDEWKMDTPTDVVHALRAAATPQGVGLAAVTDKLDAMAAKGVSGSTSACRVIGVAAPAGKTVTRIQTCAMVGSTTTPCGLFRLTNMPGMGPPGHACLAGDAGVGVAFQNYRVDGSAVAVTIRNWSDNAKVVYLRVYYR